MSVTCAKTGAGDSEKSHVRAEDSQNSCLRIDGLQNSQSTCGSSKSDDAIVQPVVEDPVDNDRILVAAGAKPILTPCERSELDKVKHELTHIPFKHCCTLCVKGKAQAEPRKRIERILEDRELPIVLCDYFVLKVLQLPTD